MFELWTDVQCSSPTKLPQPKTRLSCIWEAFGSSLDRETGRFDRFIKVFLQILQTNAGLVADVKNDMTTCLHISLICQAFYTQWLKGFALRRSENLLRDRCLKTVNLAYNKVTAVRFSLRRWQSMSELITERNLYLWQDVHGFKTFVLGHLQSLNNARNLETESVM